MNAETSVEPSEEPPVSAAYFIFHWTPEGVAEVGTNSEAKLFIRHTHCGKVLSTVPLGPCTQENVERLVDQLQRLIEIFFPPSR